jgi:adhesin transport system outer membrane protein
LKFSRLDFSVLLVILLASLSSVSQAETLEQLVKLTLLNNPEIRSSHLLREAAGAQAASARWQYYPTPSVTVQHANVSPNDSFYLGDDYSATVGVVQPLWSGGAITNNLKSAKSRLDVSEADVAQRLNSVWR